MHAQTLGGSSVYNFMKLPASPLLTASGGVNVSWKANDPGLAVNNPALLTPELNSALGLAFNSFIGGIKTYNLSGVTEAKQWQTVFGGSVYFVDYGSIPQTDAAGNRSGDFHPVDYAVQLSAGRQYLDRWHYGATVKLIGSRFGQYRSSAIAVDVGVHYSDTANKIDAAVVARNMGAQLSTYAGEQEDLPFDLEIGITKRLAKAPFGFSFTAQHLQHFDILYSDTAFNNENQFTQNHHFVSKLLNHVVVAAHIYIGANLDATVGYNQLRRSELNIGASGNGLNGFSMGLRIKFSKLQVIYAHTNYQRNIAYNQFGLVLWLNKLGMVNR